MDSIQITTIYSSRKHPSTELVQQIMTHDKTIITGDFNSRHTDFGHDSWGRIPVLGHFFAPDPGNGC